ncbi:MAG: ribosome biogenesis GTPase Der [Sphaerochaetaceae bacterium]
MQNSQSSSLYDTNLPIVAIVGRPNVGKSTLFNRLVKRKRAIVDSVAGVTRDLLFEKWNLANHQVYLVDSGGIKFEQEGLDSLVTQKSVELMENADAIVLLMDCTEITGEDQLMVEKLRPYSNKTILAVNKVDNPNREDLVWEYYRYGYPIVVGISSAHGLGIDLLEEHLLDLLQLEEREVFEKENQAIKIAILGKPNTGKSTLTNLLAKKEVSLVSDIPGTTRDVTQSDFNFNEVNYTVLDTAGIRRKSKVDEDIEYYSVNRAIKSIDDADVVLLMVDVTEGLVDQDKKIAQLIVRKGKGVILVLNKTDLLKGIGNEQEAIKDRTRFLFPILSFAPIVFISAKDNKNINKLIGEVYKVWQQLNRRIETSVLNTALNRWVHDYQIPRGTRGHFKIYYATQISVAPIRFLFFVNRKKDFPQLYINYLKNSIRRDLQFSLIPIDVQIKERN